LLAGLSYGGLIVGKMGVMYPGKFKALILFSPGVENPAHLREQKDLSAALESTIVHRRVLRNIVHDIAFSPRYDAYRPLVLNDYDPAFRESLQVKMLGELDLDLRADLDQVTDRVYMITGALDASIDPHSQIDAMRHVFRKPGARGSYILVPKGGHALWGNPAQSAEPAVLAVLREIERGTSGVFQDGGVYAWNDGTGSFDQLGSGLSGLDAAEALVDRLRPAPGK
jgi:pimeloyl-ACP methyl ester carboxylesterase